MVTRRFAVALAVAVAVLLGTAGPALADGDLSVTVAEVTPDQVRLDAEVAAADGQPPPLTVARDGWLLPSAVEVAAPAPKPDRTVVVVLDTGEEMAGASLRAARDGLLAFAAAVPADVAIGLVTAADEPAVALRPTGDRAALRTAVSKLTAGGNTAIYAGLRTAAELGTGGTDQRLLVVAGGRDDAADADTVEELSAVGRRVDLISIDPAAARSLRLREIVAATGGTVRSAAGPQGLERSMRAAAATIPLRVTITVAVPPDLAGKAGTLTVTAGNGASQRHADVDVQFASPPAASAPAAAGNSLLPRLLTPQTWLLAGLVFGTLLVSVLLTLSGVGGSVRRRRLRQVEQFRLAGRGSRSSGPGMPVPPEGGFAQTVLGLSERMAKSRGVEERVARKLDRAGMELRPHEWTAWRVGAGVAGGVLIGLAGGLLGALLGVALGWLAAGLYRRVRAARRRQAFTDQLPDALQLIVGSLKSGFSLAQAIDAVVHDSPPGPLTVELGRAMAEVRLGSDLDVALERAAQRVDNDDLAWAVMAIRIQRDTGGNLAEVLETTVETLRERDRLRRHVRALSAEGRLSAYVLVGLPVVMFIWLLLVRRDYLSVLWTTPTGVAMLAVAAALMAIGTFWMSRWVKVEV